MPRQATAAPGLDAATASPNPLSPRATPGADAPAAAAQGMRVTPYAATGVDSSSPEAFIRSIAPYAQRVSQATGIPAEALIGMACNETGYGRFAEGNNLFGIKGTGPAGSFSTQTWEDYGSGRVEIVDNFRGYHSVAESFVDFAKLVTTSERYRGAMGQTTVEGFVDGLRRGGYMTDPEYVQKISGITTHYSSTIHDALRSGGAPLSTAARTAAPATRPQAGGPAAGVKVPDQFNVGLAADEALAACGPVAAVAFAQAFGRNPTPAEALALAKQSGWTAAGGMNGIANEKRLLDKMQLPSRLEYGANWEHIQADALRKQPVILSTPGHYFVVDGYDPSNGTYHVGQSGKVYKGGSEWMTPAQIEAAAGSPNGALFTDRPMVAGERQVLPPLQVEGQRQVLPPLQVAGQQPVSPPLQVAGQQAASVPLQVPGQRPVLPPLQTAAPPAAATRPREVLAADPSVLAQLQSAPPSAAPGPPAAAPPLSAAPASPPSAAAPPAAAPPAAAPLDVAPPLSAAAASPPPSEPPAAAGRTITPDSPTISAPLPRSEPPPPTAAPSAPAPLSGGGQLTPREPIGTGGQLTPREPIGTGGQLTPREPIPAAPPSRLRDPWDLNPDIGASAGTPDLISGSAADTGAASPELRASRPRSPLQSDEPAPRRFEQQPPTQPEPRSQLDDLFVEETLLDLPPAAPVPAQPQRPESRGPAAAPYARAASFDLDSATVNVPIGSIGLPTEPAPAEKSTVLSPGAEAGLAVGAVAAGQPGSDPNQPPAPDPRQQPPRPNQPLRPNQPPAPDPRQQPPRDARRVRRPDEDEDNPPPPSSAVEDRAPRV